MAMKCCGPELVVFPSELVAVATCRLPFWETRRALLTAAPVLLGYVAGLSTVVRLDVGNSGSVFQESNRKLCWLLLGVAPLADHHGVPWAGLASAVLAVKFLLADHHGRAGLSSCCGPE